MSRARIRPGDGDARHGTLNGYNNLDCRCGACREAARVHHQSYMDAHPEQRAKARRWAERRNRAMGMQPRVRKPERCQVENCPNPCHAREMCSMHYRRFLRHGDPTVVLRPVARRAS